MAGKQLRWLCCSFLMIVSAQVYAGTQAIDQIDPLFRAIKDRLSYMHDVALSKWHNNQNIDDRQREEIVLRNVVKRAELQGLDPKSAERFFQLQISAAKEIQRGWHHAWLNQQQRPATQAPDLNTEIRPEISRLSAEIIDLLAQKQSIYSHMESAQLCPKLNAVLNVKYLSESTKLELCKALSDIKLLAQSSR